MHGDITIGIWLGKHKRDRDVPALAYQFHTEMLDADQVRVVLGMRMSQSECPNRSCHWVGNQTCCRKSAPVYLELFVFMMP